MPTRSLPVFPSVLGLILGLTGLSTRWSTTLSSKVNLHHAIDLRSLCGASLVTLPPNLQGRDLWRGVIPDFLEERILALLRRVYPVLPPREGESERESEGEGEGERKGEREGKREGESSLLTTYWSESTLSSR